VQYRRNVLSGTNNFLQLVKIEDWADCNVGGEFPHCKGRGLGGIACLRERRTKVVGIYSGAAVVGWE